MTFKVLKSHKPSITIKAAKRTAASNIDWSDTLSELIDNSILVDKKRCVNIVVNMHCRSEEHTSELQSH